MKTKVLIYALLLLFACSSDQHEGSNQLKDTDSSDTGPPNILFMIADDWSYPHAGIYGEPVIRTPTFDQLAADGALFYHAFCAAPSCSPSRAAILTSRYPHQLESAGNLWSIIPRKFPNWIKILKEHGYHTGKTQKGWGPGDYERGGYAHNPAGKDYESFTSFLQERDANQPFCFWFGSTDPHRIYETNTGIKTGMNPEDINVPGFLPDYPCVRNDIMDYYFEVERFDRECGNIIRQLEDIGELDNTLIVMTSDNGMPFPRAKANLYDYGTRMPLAVFWKGKIKSNTRIDEFINFIDFGPTFLEVAGLEIPDEFSGSSLLSLLTGEESGGDRDIVFLERERHANVREGNLSYPCRAVRNKEYLYIRNFEPDRWPAGDPETHQSVGQYGDVDNSISKFLILERQDQNLKPDLFQLAFGKRPAEELYIVAEDPYNMNNVAGSAEYANVLSEMKSKLSEWMESTGDLRFTEPHTNYWDTVKYTPDYQHENFNLAEEISSYKMLIPEGYGRFKEVPCR